MREVLVSTGANTFLQESHDVSRTKLKQTLGCLETVRGCAKAGPVLL